MNTSNSVAFVATKPLQIMTSINLAQQLALAGASLTVVPYFAAADAIVQRLGRAGFGVPAIRTAPTRIAALFDLAATGATRIYLDRDMGMRTTLALRWLRVTRPRVRYSLYEEGISLFEPAEAERPSRLSALLGATLTLGEGPFTDEVWTYDPDRLRARLPAKPLHAITTPLSAFVEQHRAGLLEVFWPAYERDVRQWRGGTCCIYLSSWEVDARALEYVTATSAFKVFKPHPHMRGDIAAPQGFDHVLDAAIPAELVLLEMARLFDEVIVVHVDSSTARYVSAGNVRFVDA